MCSHPKTFMGRIKTKSCSLPDCTYPAFAKGFCKRHQFLRQDSKRSNIAAHSIKRKRANRQYREISVPLWKDKACDIKSPHCTGMAQGWNHPAGKHSIKLLLDVSIGQPACNSCNMYIEVHPLWGIEKGFIKKRNGPIKRPAF